MGTCLVAYCQAIQPLAVLSRAGLSHLRRPTMGSVRSSYGRSRVSTAKVYGEVAPRGAPPSVRCELTMRTIV